MFLIVINSANIGLFIGALTDITDVTPPGTSLSHRGCGASDMDRAGIRIAAYISAG